MTLHSLTQAPFQHRTERAGGAVGSCQAVGEAAGGQRGRRLHIHRWDLTFKLRSHPSPKVNKYAAGPQTEGQEDKHPTITTQVTDS